MRSTAGIRFDFDPYGTAQVHVEDMERRAAASQLRAEARAARRAHQREMGAPAGRWTLRTRATQVARATAGLRLRLAH